MAKPCSDQVTRNQRSDLINLSNLVVPDVITTDLILSRMSGAELCRSLKGGVRTRHIPVIVVTGSAEESEVEAAKKAGCVSVLIKPCEPETLLEEIRRVLTQPQFAPDRAAS